MKRTYRIREAIDAKNHDGSHFMLQPGEYFADKDTEEGDWVAVYIDHRPVVVSRADFERVASLVNP
jgi:hypothetical protein